MPIEITTPVGRIVWGNPGKARPVIDKDTKQPKLTATGQPRQQWSFGVAFDKATFQQHIWPVLAAEAATVYPQGVPQKFSWKYEDGDGIDGNGQPFSIRPGYAGCYVLAINTELQAPPLFKLVNGAYQQLPPDAIKTGDFVSVGLNIKANVPTDRTHTPGLYINPLAIEFVGYGEEIQSQGSADPMALFKGQQHQLPPGASAVPVGAAGAPGMPGMGMQPPAGTPPMGVPPQQPAYPPQAAPPPMGAPAGYPAPGQAPAPQQGYMPPPAHDFVQPGGVPGYPPQAAPPPMGAPAPGYPPQQPAYPPQGAPAGYPAPGQAPGYPPQAGVPGMMPPR